MLERVKQFASSRRVRRTSENERHMKGIDMRDHYDFSHSIQNPYAKKLKKQVTIRLDEDTVAYFKKLAEEKDLPYQSLINLYLRDCAQSHKDLKIEWL
ncbi:BrnA antitoxin family protein [Salinicola salarius]|uniref:BrnA antitoxin family protein n=3 Tax=Halomonadaceae TaxID=28256 RepID=UPI00358F5E79